MVLWGRFVCLKHGRYELQRTLSSLQFVSRRALAIEGGAVLVLFLLILTRGRAFLNPPSLTQ